jgi:hypothetical protein
MLGKILLGLVCGLLLIVFAIGALGLMLDIGPMFYSLALSIIGGAGLVVFSGLLGE